MRDGTKPDCRSSVREGGRGAGEQSQCKASGKRGGGGGVGEGWGWARWERGDRGGGGVGLTCCKGCPGLSHSGGGSAHTSSGCWRSGRCGTHSDPRQSCKDQHTALISTTPVLLFYTGILGLCNILQLYRLALPLQCC